MKYSKQIIRITFIGAGINLLLFFVKLYIGLSVNSVAIYADAMNNLLDCILCTASAAVYAAFSKPKADYPFGCGKIEELLELAVSAAITIAGLGFAYASFERIFYPTPVWYSSAYAAVIALTAAIKLALFLFFRTYSKKYSSSVVKGFSADSLLDFFITLCSLISFMLSDKLNFPADGFAGIIISIILTVHGAKATVSSIGKLIGKRDTHLCNRIRNILENEEKILHVTEVECHCYGNNKVITAKVNADCSTADDIYCLTEEIENKVKKETGYVIYLVFGG